MKRIVLVAVIALLSLHAFADTTTLTFDGTIFNISDNIGLFGTQFHNYSSGAPISGTISWDPTTFGACNNPPNGCTWNVTSANHVVETLTFTGNNNVPTTLTFNVTSAQLQFNVGGGTNSIQFNNGSGTGFTMNIQFGDSTSFFGNPPNLSPALHFSTVNTSFGSGNDNETQNSQQTSIGFAVAHVSANTVSAVPEPCSLALLASGLVGVGFRKLRGRRS